MRTTFEFDDLEEELKEKLENWKRGKKNRIIDETKINYLLKRLKSKYGINYYKIASRYGFGAQK